MSGPTDTGSRTGYVIALVVAVAALVGSMLAVGVYTVSQHNRWGSSGNASAQQWRPGPGPGGMMDGRNGGGTRQGRQRGGVMGNWSGTALTQQQATEAARAWLAANRPEATLGTGVQMPMGWLFSLTGGGSLMVHNNGQVTYYDATVPSAPPGTGPSAPPSAGSGT